MASIKQLLEMNVWDDSKQQWVDGAPKTVASAVSTADGSDVQTKFDDVQTKFDAVPWSISEAVDTAVTNLRGGVSEEGNTLNKLYASIGAIKTLLAVDDTTLDTLQEIVDYIKEHGTDLEQIGINKVNYADIINALDTVGTLENKVLDARQGKVLKDLIDTVDAEISEIKTVTLPEMSDRLTVVISDTAPESPLDGQLWFKPAGVVEI